MGCTRGEPAALLAEALLLAGDGDDGRLGVRLADLVPAVVVAALGQVRRAPLHGARRHRLLSLPRARPLRRRGRRRPRRQRGGRRRRGRPRPPARRPAQLEVQRPASSAGAGGRDDTDPAAGADHRAQVPRGEHLGVPVHGKITAALRVSGSSLLLSGLREKGGPAGLFAASDGCFCLKGNCDRLQRSKQVVGDNRTAADLEEKE